MNCALCFVAWCNNLVLVLLVCHSLGLDWMGMVLVVPTWGSMSRTYVRIEFRTPIHFKTPIQGKSTVNISRLRVHPGYSRLPVTQTAPWTINRQHFGLPSPSMPGNRHRRETTNRPISVQKHPAQRCVLCSRLPVTRATVANLGVLPPLEVCGVTCNRSSVELWPTRHLKHLLFQAFPHHPWGSLAGALPIFVYRVGSPEGL